MHHDELNDIFAKGKIESLALSLILATSLSSSGEDM